MLKLYFYCMTVLLQVDLYLHLFALFMQLCSVSGMKEYLCSVFMPLKWAGWNSAITSALKREKLLHNRGQGSRFSLWIMTPDIYDLIPNSVCVRHHILSACLSLLFLPLFLFARGNPDRDDRGWCCGEAWLSFRKQRPELCQRISRKLQRDAAKSGGMSK